MTTLILLDQIHVDVFLPKGTSDRQAVALARALRKRTVLNAIRNAVRGVIRQKESGLSVTIRVNR